MVFSLQINEVNNLEYTNKNYESNEMGGLANADRADKGGRGGWGNANNGWQRGLRGVGEILKLADKGAREGPDPSIFGWHNLWTAPYLSDAWLIHSWESPLQKIQQKVKHCWTCLHIVIMSIPQLKFTFHTTQTF